MSFDLSLAKGDLVLGADNDLAKVREGSKLVQDILKLLFTPLGSDPYFLTKGSTLTTDNIGETVNDQFMLDRARASILNTLKQLQTIQQVQALTQTVTPEETLKEINEVSVARDEQELRQYNIRIVITTGAYSVISIPEFSISTNLVE